jgi:hypothetical protein
MKVLRDWDANFTPDQPPQLEESVVSSQPLRGNATHLGLLFGSDIRARHSRRSSTS